VVTAEEMRQAVLKHYSQADLVIMAAAVADFRFKKILDSKVGKTSFGPVLEIEKTPDILEELGQAKTKQLLVGFAAETSQLIEKAAEKMHRKKLDLMVANDVSVPGLGFGSEENEVWLLWPDGRSRKIPRMSKRQLSREIFLEIERLWDGRKGIG